MLAPALPMAKRMKSIVRVASSILPHCAKCPMVYAIGVLERSMPAPLKLLMPKEEMQPEKMQPNASALQTDQRMNLSAKDKGSVLQIALTKMVLATGAQDRIP